MKARVRWVGDRTFIGESGTGHSVLFGNPHGEGALRPGPSPMEMLLIGTGGCSSFDVVHILEKGREPVEGCTVDVEAERADTDPKVFTRIHMHFTVKGRALDPRKVERAVQHAGRHGRGGDGAQRFADDPSGHRRSPDLGGTRRGLRHRCKYAAFVNSSQPPQERV